MANPYDKFLNTESITEGSAPNNPYDQYLPAGDRNQSLFSTSTEDPPVDYTKPLELPEEKNPYLKFVDTGEFNTGTDEDVALSKKVGNAFYLGFIDTARGVNQMSGGDLFGASSLEELREQQKNYMKTLMALVDI